MKAVILAGGFGTRLAEETEIRPKPLVEIGGRPILWHIMKHFAHFDLREFYVALGYKGDDIKQYFLDYYALSNDLTVNLRTGAVEPHQKRAEDWTVHLIDTGYSTLTGGRVKRLEPYLKGETFLVTYGDGVSDVDVNALIDFHHSAGRIATVTAVRPPARFGGLHFDDERVAGFSEKSQADEGWINGGFLVFSPRIFDYLQGDATSLEMIALEALAADGQLAAYKHYGFWQCMDTVRDKLQLESIWNSGDAPWKVWS
ncbi:MAG: glucose-phosphate cytidylyltransferase [Acidobacteriota bacterium]|jgi:glucose-1-phosphate cytidylyltransferase|nr:glucose-phosphate cytidylyltransferase [Acidobacteriota bacterium]